MIDSALGAAGTSAAMVGLDKLGQVGVLYHGLDVLGSGATIVGMVLGAMAAFIIDKKFVEASAFAAGRRGADVLRLHARRGGRHCRLAHGRARLRDGRGVAVCPEPRARVALRPRRSTTMPAAVPAE